MVSFSPFLSTVIRCAALPFVMYATPPFYSPISKMTSSPLSLNSSAQPSFSSSHSVLPRPPPPKSLHLPLPQMTKSSKYSPSPPLSASACWYPPGSGFVSPAACLTPMSLCACSLPGPLVSSGLSSTSLPSWWAPLLQPRSYRPWQRVRYSSSESIILHVLGTHFCFSSTTLAPDINRTQGLFMEMFATAGLCLVVLMLAAEKHRATPFAPVGIGLTLFAGQLCVLLHFRNFLSDLHRWLTYYTGCAMNAARAFGPAVLSQFPNYHWIASQLLFHMHQHTYPATNNTVLAWSRSRFSTGFSHIRPSETVCLGCTFLLC